MLQFLPWLLLLILAEVLEIVVFNEEIFLALCFISFVFTSYNYLNQTVSDIFAERAKKFENDIVKAFHSKFVQLSELSSYLTQQKQISTAIACFKAFVEFSALKQAFDLEPYLHSINVKEFIISKFSKIALIEQNIIINSQNTIMRNVIFSTTFALSLKT